MTTVFTSKLDRLIETVTLAADFDQRGLAAAMGDCSTAPVVAVGSGGSAIVAEFFATCRSGLGHCPTAIVTPMALVLDAAGVPGTPAWLFSATGGNPDILAAFDAAIAEHRGEVDVLTSAAEGTLAATAASLARSRKPSPRVHLAPVADPKDGFLATHSAVSAAASLTIASDELAGAPPREDRKSSLLKDCTRFLSKSFRQNLREHHIAPLSSLDTVFVLHDPHLSAAAVLIETSFWEAGICGVQRSDFRNFAHGRHVWMARHPDRTFVLALTCDRSQKTWHGIRAELPANIPSAHFDFGRHGRGGLFAAVLTSLGIVEAAGDLKGVDPGKPGVADFGKRIFERQDLRDAMNGDDASTRRKRRARGRTDPTVRDATDWPACRDKFAANLAEAKIRGIVLDYDGTVVSTAHRLQAPRPDIVERLTALADQGITIGFATGRGGSIGEMLRMQLPKRLHHAIIVGYYNGAHIVSLDVDIEKRPPNPDPLIAKVHSALCTERDLFADAWRPKAGRLQITIPFEKLRLRDKGIERICEIVESAAAQAPAGAKARVFRSGHSIDVFPSWAGKSMVVKKIASLLGDSAAAILRVGDSGDCQGNDYELLDGGLGLSVDRVCHREETCWNLSPAGTTGPDGLVRVLGALTLLAQGAVCIDVSVLFAS
jgi:hydroxymethylpyrimidine pyrophosphatase-like HAD family hydrolase